MKIYTLLLLSAFIALTANSQSCQGFRTGNYTSVNGVFFNPANVVDSRYSWGCESSFRIGSVSQ